MSSSFVSETLVPAILPVTAGCSLLIYLTSSTTSPFRRRRIALPTRPEEPVDGPRPRDPFDLVDDDLIFQDGEPIQGDKFWRWTTIQKVLFVATFLIATGYNIFLYTNTTRRQEHQLYRLLIPAHCITLLLGLHSISIRDVPRHWASTIHLSVLAFLQLVILATLALLPSTPLPSPSTEVHLVAVHLPHWFPSLRSWLPILHIPPMIIISCVRRGPPLYFPLDGIYPPKITDAVPNSATALRHDLPNVSEEVEATVPEWLMFSYATNVVKKGNVSETMDVWDLPILPAGMRALPQYTRMKAVYQRATRRLGKMEGFNLLWKLAKANKGPLIAQTLLAAVTGAGYYVPHYLLKLFLNYLENDSDRSDPAWGWLLAFGLFVSNAIIYVASGVLWSLSTTVLQAGIKLQLNTLLFGKTLVKKDIAATGDKLGTAEKPDEKEEEKEGEDEEVNSKTQIMTLFTVDVDRVTDFVFHEFALIDAPMEIVVATIFLFKLLGVSALFGLLGTLFSLPLSHLASKIVIRVQEGLMKTRDQRTALMNELLQGIRMLKFMAWERSFEKRIHAIRKKELQWQARNYQIEVGFNILWAVTPVIVTVISFLHFTLVRGQYLSPSIAFTSIAVFAELRYALTVLPETFIQALQGFVSCRRIEKYLSLAEVQSASHSDPGADITMTSATFTWPKDDSAAPILDGSRSTAVTPKTAFLLFDLSLRFPHGKLSLICGRLGSGKSLLLAGLLGEADLVAGTMDCPRSAPDAMAMSSKRVIHPADWILHDMVAYVPQQAWLQNASIKENIVFNSPWDQNRYDRVLDACSLLSDLKILEDGDETEIGEKGLNLSGGQKARVSLARAVYSRAGVLLLDDVLSAVDAHTAHALLVNCLQGEILRGRTVLLVSHHTALVSPAAAYIVALENGSVKFSGKREEFVQCGLMDELDAEEAAPKKVEEIKEVEDTPPRVKPSHKSLTSLVGISQDPDSETSSLAPDDEETLNNSQEELKKQRTPRKLIEDEKRATGRIAWPVWRLYFRALGGNFWWLFFIVGMTGSMLMPLAEKGWLGYWTGSHKSQVQHSTAYFVSGYAIVAIGGCFVTNIPYAVAYYGSIQASRKLHDAMLQSVLFATLRFHDTTSRGRLLNRFGKDIEGLDSSMVDNFVRSTEYGLLTAVTFASITYVGGIPFVIAGCLILVVYYRAGSIYGQTSRDMRRLDSITKSPLYSLFGETVSGVAVIRAFGASTVALKTMLRLADTNLLAFAWTWTVNRWLSARFNVLSSFVIGVTACAILISPTVSAASAGFALAFAATLSHNLLFVVRRFVQLEQSMVALERIKEYSELKTEAPEYVEPRPQASWPDKGEISVQDLVIRYAPDLPNVLHGINFNVKAQEKVGVVGQTGSGKSTLALSFFRFVEATEGRIIIDGLDISRIGLTDLRSRVTIIPQDPMILSGTIRSAIDVFDEYDDADIYAALKRVHLLPSEDTEEDEEARNKNVFRDLSNPVSEGGDNFSSGEKQLICMARAILRRNRLIFMDEATASIDYETDELISKTIREEFSTSTILTIAHRIRTIIDFDKVLVMDEGRIIEYDDPAVLLRNHKSKFYGLCKATGKTEFKILKAMASEGEKKRQKRISEP